MGDGKNMDSASATLPGVTPLCCFGVISDVQYADIDNGQNFHKTRVRYYRNALEQLKRAVDEWSCQDSPSVDFVLELGDLIDGQNRRVYRDNFQQAYDATEDIFSSISCDVHHVWGNHELYNFHRAALYKSSLNTSTLPGVCKPKDSEGRKAYYHFSPVSGFRIVILDMYEIGLLGYDPNSREYLTAERIVKAINHNQDLNNPDNLLGMERRFCKFNGALSEEQLVWLDEVLSQCDKHQEKAMIAGHMPVFVDASAPLNLCWNYEAVLAVLHKHASVVAFLCGHDHEGGYSVDQHGIHHITMPGVIETHPTIAAHSTMTLYHDRLQLQGKGRVPHVDIPFTDTNIQDVTSAAHDAMTLGHDHLQLQCNGGLPAVDIPFTEAKIIT